MREQKVRPQINARAERIASAPMFKDSYARRRCILPIDGFFEWRTSESGKQPFAIAMKDGSPFGVAGIWTAYRADDGRWVHNFAVLTCEANDFMAAIHHRMPLILPAEAYDRWLANIEPDPAIS